MDQLIITCKRERQIVLNHVNKGGEILRPLLVFLLGSKAEQTRFRHVATDQIFIRIERGTTIATTRLGMMKTRHAIVP